MNFQTGLIMKNLLKVQKKPLFDILKNIELEKLSKEQKIFLDKLNILQNINQFAIDKMEDVF